VSGAEVFVLTWREGLLSRFGHDLRLRMRRFEIELEDGSVRARFVLASLTVDGAIVGGRIDPAAISASDRRDIERTIVNDVLPVRRHPDAIFEGRADASDRAPAVSGKLTLGGRTIALAPFFVLERDGAWRAGRAGAVALRHRALPRARRRAQGARPRPHRARAAAGGGGRAEPGNGILARRVSRERAPPTQRLRPETIMYSPEMCAGAGGWCERST
jgi:hypothetical protein